MSTTPTDELAGLDPDGTTLEQWDRWPDEPPAAYGHFDHYRGMGRARTLRKVAGERQVSEQYLMQLSAKWQWVRRSQAWDAEQVRLHEARMRDRRYELAEQHLSVANLLVAKAVQRLRDLEPSKLNARDLLAYIEAGIKVQRMVVGESTERVEHVDGGAADDVDLGAMSDEQIREHLAGLQTEIGRRIQ
jgi:glutathione S-transferase